MKTTLKSILPVRLWLPVLTLVVSLLAIFSTLLSIEEQQQVVFWGLPLALCLWLAAAVLILLLAAIFALLLVLGAGDD